MEAKVAEWKRKTLSRGRGGRGGLHFIFQILYPFDSAQDRFNIVTEGAACLFTLCSALPAYAGTSFAGRCFAGTRVYD